MHWTTGGDVDQNGCFTYVILGWTAGGDVEKLGHFQRRKSRSHDSIFFASPLEGDVEKIGHFQRENTALEGTTLFQSNI